MEIPESLSAPAGLAEPDLFADGFPHDLFTQLRRHKPVCWSHWSGGTGFWSLTRYEDITYAGKNPQIFSSAVELGGHRVFDERSAGVAGTGGGEQAPVGTPFISRDSPRHIQQREPVMRSMNPARLKQMSERIRSRVVQLLDAVPRKQPFDVVKYLSAPLPINTLAGLLDIPPEREGQLVEWTNAFIGEDDPGFRQSPEYMARIMGEFLEYIGNLRSERSNAGHDDVISLLTRQRDGSEVSPADFFANMILVLVGGNETTRNSLSGGLIALASNPRQWRMIRDNPDVIDGAVNEIVRWVSPVMHMRRSVTEDIVVGGVTLAAGDKVLLWYPSANRDEAVWPDRPQVFDITRPVVRHRGFGIGAHVCVGSRLAELQIKIFLQELSQRCASFAVEGEVMRIRSSFIDGIRSLPMRFQWC